MILGNDLAGGEVFPTPIVVNDPVRSPSVATQSDQLSQMPTVFPACVITWAQSHKSKDVVDLSKTFIAPQEEVVEPVSLMGLPATSEVRAAKQAVEANVVETVEVALSSPTT